METEKSRMTSVKFTGNVTFHGPMFDIHDNQHVHVGTPEMEKVDQLSLATEKGESSEARNEELTSFVHPSVSCDQEWLIHDEIKRLVKRQGIQEICQYLLELREENKILLPQMAEKAYRELVRLGMSDGEGYSLKTFMKYYRK